MAGFKALTEAGPAALKAEPLARRLGTTKGSFYWHFSDVATYHQALMLHWESRAFRDIVDALDDQDGPVQKLRSLGLVATASARDAFGGIGLEPAIRAWSRENSAVAQAVARVDGKRMAYLSGLMAEIGLSNPDLTRILYAAFVGTEDLSTRDGVDNASSMGSLVDLILALHA